VTQHSGEGKANQYFLRGYNLDHGTDMAIWVDDVPVNMRTHAHGQGYADLNWLMPETVNSLDIRKGPYFADKGDFGSAGSLHIRVDRQRIEGDRPDHSGKLRLQTDLRDGRRQGRRRHVADCGRGRHL
jgi:TonB-dependent Receptor Plug Domain